MNRASKLQRVVDLAAVATSPGGRQALTRWQPRSLAAFRLVSALRDHGVRPATVLDVGANIGQFSRAATELLGRPPIHAFEPHPDAARSFRSNLAHAPQVHLHQVALGSEDRATVLHAHRYTLTSSLRPVRPGPVPSWATGACSGIEVDGRRLDSVLSLSDLRGPALLKVDVQGTELEVLDGVGALMDAIEWIVLETSFEEVYDGEPLFDEVHQYVHDRGWALRAPLDVFRSPDDGRVTQLDVLFGPKQATAW